MGSEAFAYKALNRRGYHRAICVSAICAVRLARDDINHPSPKLTCAVADSVALARAILKKVVGR